MITIATWNKCNNKCVMCTNPPDYGEGDSYVYDNLVGRFGKIDKKETEIYLTGGEPTIHPRIFDFLNFLRNRCPGAKITVVTNGRLLCYPDFTKRILQTGNINFQIAVHGFEEKLHDRITTIPGSFKQTTVGLKNLLKFRKKDTEIEIRVIVHRLTLPHLPKIYKFLLNNFSETERIVFIFLEMEGMAGINIKKVGTKYRDAMPHIKKLSHIFDTEKIENRLYHFPLCVLPQSLWPLVWRTLPQSEIVFPKFCNICKVKKLCLGIHRDYSEHMGFGGFKPVKTTVDNLVLSKNFHHPIEKIT